LIGKDQAGQREAAVGGGDFTRAKVRFGLLLQRLKAARGTLAVNRSFTVRLEREFWL
jgi:hypothetical protein